MCVMCQALGDEMEDGQLQVEDLRHFLVECIALDPIRDQFPVLFRQPGLQAVDRVKFILDHPNQCLVASALQSLYEARCRGVELCCSGEGEPLLPPGYMSRYVDLFESDSGGEI